MKMPAFLSYSTNYTTINVLIVAKKTQCTEFPQEELTHAIIVESILM